MKYTLFFIFFLLSLSVHAQNIVPNYSFEEADSCPTNYNQSTYEYSLGCIGWGDVVGTADYYNACDTAASSVGSLYPIVGVPRNFFGYQSAYDGVAYTGIATYDSEHVSYRELLIHSLPALEIDTPYFVSIEVSLADSARFATDGLGVLFTTYGKPNIPPLGAITETPQIDYTSYGVITDTTHWIKLSGTFVADSAYTSLIIGGFKSTTDMTIVPVNNFPKITNPPCSYYYVDYVVVQKLSTLNITNAPAKIDCRVYPNPFTEHTTLIFNNTNEQGCSFTLFNEQGQIVQKTENITSSVVRIDRNNLPSGFYYYQLRNGNSIIANGKLIIN